MSEVYSIEVYETLITSKIDYVKFVKNYINAPHKVEIIKYLDNNSNISENEKLLIYLFIDNVIITKKLFIRRCDKCKFEWFSTERHTVHCEKCR